MKISNAPTKHDVAFGVNGSRESLLDTTPTGSARASYDSGFPAITMTAKAAGGLPPKGPDMNQILYELSLSSQWGASGVLYQYDAAFAAAIGGYPKGGIVLGTDGLTIYQSQVDDNNAALTDTSSWSALPTSSTIIPASQVTNALGGTVQESFVAITPEMFGAVGDGSDVDDLAAIQAAVDFARTSVKYRVAGMGKYRISGPIKIDNFTQGGNFFFQDLVAHSTFPTTTDWKTANGMIEVGGESTGSQGGLYIQVGFAGGSGTATVVKALGGGVTGSTIRLDRVDNVIGAVDLTNPDLKGCSSNLICGGNWTNGLYGIRARRKGSYVVEGTQICVGFINGFKYGAIQLFDGAQYFDIYGTGVDFCGRNLTQLTLNALPPVSVRETNLTNAAGASFEVLDVYQQTAGVYNILVIESKSVEGGTDSFAVGDSVTVGDVAYTVSAVTTSTKNQAYFDFIHGFQGAAFARGKANFNYLSKAVGGGFNSTTINWGNSFQEVTNSVNNIWLRQQGSAVSIVDRWTATVLAKWDTTSNGQLTLPAGFITQSASSLGGTLATSTKRVYGMESGTTLVKGTAKGIRTMAYAGDGTISGLREMWEVFVIGPNGYTGCSGSFLMAVNTTGIEIIGTVGLSAITISTSGLTVQALQSGQDTMQVVFMFNRK